MTEFLGTVENPPRAGFLAAASEADVPPGWVLKARLGGREIALANCEGTFHAVENSCTHAGGPLGDSRLRQDCLLECPWHNSRFDVRTGQPTQGPARKPIKTYEVVVKDGTVFVATELSDAKPPHGGGDDGEVD